MICTAACTARRRVCNAAQHWPSLCRVCLCVPLPVYFVLVALLECAFTVACCKLASLSVVCRVGEGLRMRRIVRPFARVIVTLTCTANCHRAPTHSRRGQRRYAAVGLVPWSLTCAGPGQHSIFIGLGLHSCVLVFSLSRCHVRVGQHVPSRAMSWCPL